MPQLIFCTSKQTTHNKKRAPYRTFLPHRTSAERGQEKIQRHYRAPSRTTRSNHLHGKIEGRSPQVCCKCPLFLLHRARRSSFSPHPEKKKRGVHPQQRIAFQKEAKTSLPNGTLAQCAAPAKVPDAPPRGQAVPRAQRAAGSENPPPHWKIPHHFHGKAKKFTIPPLQCPGLRYNRAILLMHVLQGRVQVPTGGKAREPKGMIR